MWLCYFLLHLIYPSGYTHVVVSEKLLALSFYHVYPEDHTRVIWLDSKCLYLLYYLSSPNEDLFV